MGAGGERDPVRYSEVTAKSALTRVYGMPYFSWSLNPYTGCSHACSYCFARQYHALRERDPGRGFDRKVEPETPPPAPRLEAMRRLRGAGLDAGVLAAPILPGLSDSEASLDAVARAARDHDATFFHHRPLKLDPGVKPHYFAFLAEHFPALLPQAAA